MEIILFLVLVFIILIYKKQTGFRFLEGTPWDRWWDK